MRQSENIENIDPTIARRIIEVAGGNGIPPEYGFQFFTVGLDPYLTVLEEEYLSSFIKDGGSSFKMVVGVYGGGKTHFLYCIRDLAWKYNYATSYVSLSPAESPFHKLDLVYRAIVNGLTPPLTAEELLSGYEKGIESFIRSWYIQKYRVVKSYVDKEEQIYEELDMHLDEIYGIESGSFANAVKEAFRALMYRRDEDFAVICQWLKNEGYDRKLHGRFRIFQHIDQSTAPQMIRSLAQWIKQIGYTGLVILLDEAERIPSLSTKNREQHLSNLREIIDECGHTSLQSAMIFYAVPDENFLEGRTQVYEALRQRVSPVFDDRLNPTGVKIALERLEERHEPLQTLVEIGRRLESIYEKAYNFQFPPAQTDKLISRVANECYEKRFGDIGYKRLFVQELIRNFHEVRRERQTSSGSEGNVGRT